MEDKIYTELQQLPLKPFDDYNLCVRKLNARTQQRKMQRRISRQHSRKSVTTETHKETPVLDPCCHTDGMLRMLGIKQELNEDNDTWETPQYPHDYHQDSNHEHSENGYGVDSTTYAEESKAVMEIGGFKYDYDPAADFQFTDMAPADYCHYPLAQGSAIPAVIPNETQDYGMLQSYSCHSRPEVQISKPSPPHCKQKQKKLQRGCRLWEFIRDLLQNPRYNPSHIRWVDRQLGEFRLIKSNQIARMWGEKKNNDCMTYEKLSRAMRYYYKRGILAPVLGKRLVYRFGEKSHGWK